MNARIHDQVIAIKHLQHVPVVRVVHLLPSYQLHLGHDAERRTSALPSTPTDSSLNVGVPPPSSSSPFFLEFA